MDFVTIEFDRDCNAWVPDVMGPNPEAPFEPFFEAAEKSELMWEYLDKLQCYQFKVVYEDERPVGLRFLGVETRWGEFVSASSTQLVLKSPI